MLCATSFIVGMILTDRLWDNRNERHATTVRKEMEMLQGKFRHKEGHCDHKKKYTSMHAKTLLGEMSRTHDTMATHEKTISALEMELAAARASQSGSSLVAKPEDVKSEGLRKVFVVIGINTAFNGRQRRDSIRETWMPKGEKLKLLEQVKGIVIRFVIGHSATPGSVLDRAINAEEAMHGDFLRLDHKESYQELSAKTKMFFSTVVAKWDADFYVKVDDDVHVNLGMLGLTLARHRSKPLVYIGCMKSGPVLVQKGVKYQEPEYWKFGEEGNKYFRHAAGQLYAISKDLATYISINEPILHKYANEDVSLGSWLIGLNVEQINDRSLCCGTPPDCEWKTQAGNACVASFDWHCSGICKSASRMKDVHQRCSEGVVVWSATF